MFPIIPLRTTAFLASAMFLVVMFSVRLVQPAFWRSPYVKVLVVAVFGTLALGLGLWATGEHLQRWPMVTDGAGLTYVGMLSLAPAACVTPISAALDRGLMRLTRPAGPAPASGAPSRGISRRGLIRAGAAALPTMAAATGASGFASARSRPRLPVVTMRYDDLHPDLEGFRILHLSDVHLGACVSLADVEAALDAACAKGTPDLVVVTGDLADDVSQIPGALELVAKVAAKHGAFASLGNHEYLHDIAHVRPLYEASPVPLLVSSGRTLQVGGARLFVAGADDPVLMQEGTSEKLEPSIREAARHAPAHADFRLLLCHRPEGLGPAAAHGFDLTLAGHTHGGQIGMLGRSLLEHVRPGVGWWGTYERERPLTAAAQRSVLRRSPSRLYTTSGFGHWFPFRLGCPTELPIIVLTGAPRPRRIGSSPA
ncbi:MAG: metallophosphoesterase [Labilithrix sp.]|nr:metallophosphoesterase [Labilithrix sp.]